MWRLLYFTSILYAFWRQRERLHFGDSIQAALQTCPEGSYVNPVGTEGCVWPTFEMCRYNIGKVVTVDPRGKLNCIVTDVAKWDTVASMCQYPNVTSDHEDGLLDDNAFVTCGNSILRRGYPFCARKSIKRTSALQQIFYSQYCD
jgi:hypothetical protein